MSEQIDSCKVWTRFESKRKDGSAVKLRIQELPSERIDEAIQYLVDNCINEEAFQVAAGIGKNEESIQEYRGLFKAIMESAESYSVMCCLDEPDVVGQIIGLSIMAVTLSSNKLKDNIHKMNIKTDEMRKLFHILMVLGDHIPDLPFETSYDGRVISVHKDYRRLGIANEFVRVRELVCVEHNMRVTRAWMTAIGTQKPAENNNWKTFFEISLEEMDKITGLTFEKKLKSFKLMYKSIE